MTDTKLQSKIQKLELDTIRVVTELQKDVQNLTREVANLAEQVQKMAENYVTSDKHTEDIAQIKLEIAEAKRLGAVRTLSVALLTALVTAMVTYELSKLFK